MSCLSEDLQTKLSKQSASLASLGSLTALLALSGIVVVIWMASTSFSDITGLIVGLLFIVCSIIQVVFGLVWWRAIQRHTQMYDVQLHEDETEVLKQASAKSPHTGNGDAPSAGVMMTDEVKVAYTDGAQKIDAVEMVSV